MQGLGPETILVHNSRDLSHFIYRYNNPMHCAPLQRLRQNLQTLLVIFQSNSPQLWVDAAESVRGWIDLTVMVLLHGGFYASWHRRR